MLPARPVASALKCIALFALSSLPALHGQMSQERLHELIRSFDEDAQFEGPVVRFVSDGVTMLYVSDPSADRMRLISPIIAVSEVSEAELFLAMNANFHSALDARYAVSEGVVYSAFIHWLSPLTEEQIHSAVRQVGQASRTFGTTYSSGELYYGSPKSEESEEPSEDGEVEI